MPGEHHGAFGEDAFGRRAEKIARFLTEQVADLMKQIHDLLIKR